VVETWRQQLLGAVVVEAGSGEGYGAALLRDAGAGHVIALEFDPASVAHAATTYAGVTTLRANLAAMPLADRSVDVLVSLQVVEHLWDLRGFLLDCRRVLRPGGSVVVSTPNRLVFSPGLERGEKPTNPFHVEEFDAEQLGELMTDAGFTDVELYGLHHGEHIREWERSNSESLVAAQVHEALNPGPGTDLGDLRAFVASVRASDFVVGVAAGAQDLIALGRT
jgi:SAM-dependent methyltransferase